MSNNNSSIFVIAVAAMFILCGASAAVIIASSNNDNGYVSDYTLGYNDGVRDANEGFIDLHMQFKSASLAALKDDALQVPAEASVADKAVVSEYFGTAKVADIEMKESKTTYSNEYIRGYLDGFESAWEPLMVKQEGKVANIEAVFTEQTVPAPGMILASKVLEIE